MNRMNFAIIRTGRDGQRTRLATYPTQKEAARQSFNHGMAELQAFGFLNMRYCNISGTFVGLNNFGAVVLKLGVEAVIESEAVSA